MATQELQSTAEVSATGSFEELENRIAAIVEQLRQEREARLQAERETERLRARLAEWERELARLRSYAGDIDGQRKEVIRRVESLLETVEKLEQDGEQGT